MASRTNTANTTSATSNFNNQFQQAPTAPKKKKSGSNVIVRAYTAEYGAWGMAYEHYKENKELYSKLSLDVQRLWLADKAYNLQGTEAKMEWINRHR